MVTDAESAVVDGDADPADDVFPTEGTVDQAVFNDMSDTDAESMKDAGSEKEARSNLLMDIKDWTKAKRAKRNNDGVARRNSSPKRRKRNNLDRVVESWTFSKNKIAKEVERDIPKRAKDVEGDTFKL